MNEDPVSLPCLDWLRGPERRWYDPSEELPGPEVDAILLANVVGFAGVTLMDIWGVFSGSGRPVMKLFLVIHLSMTSAFVLARRATIRRLRPQTG